MFDDFLCQADFQLGGADAGEVDARHSLGDGVVDGGMVVPKDDGTESGVIIQIAFAVDIDEVGAVAGIPDDGFCQSARAGVDAAGRDGDGSFKKRCVCHVSSTPIARANRDK